MKNNLVEFAPIQGSLTAMLDCLSETEETLDMLCRSRFRDQEGQVIGFIDSYDLVNDLWYGRLLKDSAVYQNMLNGTCKGTFEFVLKGVNST